MMIIDACARCREPLGEAVPSVSLEGWVPVQNRKVSLLAWCDQCWAMISHVVLRQAGAEWQ